jgi:excisionase family DNA binding protein
MLQPFGSDFGVARSVIGILPASIRRPSLPNVTYHIVILPSVRYRRNWQTGDVFVCGAIGRNMPNRKPSVKSQRTLAPTVAERAEESKKLANYVTTKRAADLLGVDRTQVARLVRDRRISGIKLGHDWLVYTPSLRAYHEAKSPGGRPPSRIPRLK